MILLTFIGTLLFLLPVSTALEVVSSSTCYSQCGGGGTAVSDLVCDDGSYTTAANGKMMQGCLSCESTSLAVNGTNSDEYWFMFNMKYTLQTCVIDASSKIAGVTACAQQCQPLQPVLDTLWLAATPHAGQYDYCAIQSGLFPAQAPACASCLQSQSGSVILGNFMNIMSSACASKSLAANQQLVALPRPLFESSTIASSSTTSTATTASATTTTAAVVVGSVSSASTSTASTAGSTTATSQPTTTSSTPTSQSTSSSTNSAATTNPSSLSNTNTTTTSSKSKSLSPTTSLAIGLVIGLLGGLSITFLLYLYNRRRRSAAHRAKSSPSLVEAADGRPETRYGYNYSDAAPLAQPVVGVHEKDGGVPTVQELDGGAVADAGQDVTALPQRRWTNRGRNVINRGTGELEVGMGAEGGGKRRR